MAENGQQAWRRIAFYAVIIIVFLALALAYAAPMVAHAGDHVLGNTGESILHIYIMSWTSHTLASNPLNLYNTPMFFPNKSTLAYTDNEFSISLAAMPVLLLTGNPVLSYNIMLVLSFVLSALAGFLLVRHLTGDDLAGFAGGIVFGFPIYKIGHIAHLNLLSTAFIAFAMLCLHLYTERKKPLYAFLFVAFTVGLFLTSWGYGFFVVLAAIIYLVVLAVVKRHRVADLVMRRGDAPWRRAAWRWVAWLAVASIAGALVLLPFALPYLRLGEQDPGYQRRIEEVEYYSPDVEDFLVTPAQSLVWGGATRATRANTTDRAGAAERSLFPGLIPLALAAAGFVYLVRRRKTDGWFIPAYYPALLVSAAVLSLGVTLYFFGNKTAVPMPYRLLYYIFPGFKAIRVPGRMFVLVLLSLTVLAGFGVKWLHTALSSRFDRKAAVAVCLLVAALLAVEMLPSGLKARRLPLEKDFPAAYKWVAAREGTAPTIALPMPKPVPPDGVSAAGFSTLEPWRIYYDTAGWKGIVNGYSGYIPATYRDAAAATASFPSDESIAFLEGLGVRYVIMEGRRYRSTVRAHALARARRDPDFRLVKRYGLDYVFELK